MTSFSHTLLQWYYANQRTLPWRNETSPYKIWVSEIILQQTRVNQGWNYYLNFMDTFPTIEALAAASEQEVLKVWQGLGYYSRARYMHETARFVMTHHGGKFPETYEEIRKLKGIGDYTAAAIGSIAFQLPYPAVDGNVLRVISRFFGIFDDISQSKTRQKITEKIVQLMKGFPPGDFNQALMEFGAIQCTPRNPICENCPFNTSCFAYTYEKIPALPFKSKKITEKKRYFQYLFFIDEKEQTLIQKRTEKDIWKNLYQFPLVEIQHDDFNIHHYLEKRSILSLQPSKKIKEVRHLLTHQTIFASFYLILVKNLPLQFTETFLIVPVQDLHHFPVSALMSKAIVSFLENKR